MHHSNAVLVEPDFMLPVMQKYTEALTLCPGWSGTSCCTADPVSHLPNTCPDSCGSAVLLVNRALCQKKKEAWSLVQQDAKAALSIDSHLLKVGCWLPMIKVHNIHGPGCMHCRLIIYWEWR